MKKIIHFVIGAISILGISSVGLAVPNNQNNTVLLKQNKQKIEKQLQQTATDEADGTTGATVKVDPKETNINPADQTKPKIKVN